MSPVNVTVSLSIAHLLENVTNAFASTENITAKHIYQCAINATSVTPENKHFKVADVLDCWSRVANAEDDDSIAKHMINFSILALQVTMHRRLGLQPHRQLLDDMHGAWAKVVGDDEPMSPTSVSVSI